MLAAVAVLCCRYFGNVCELDLIFNFHKAYYILDELLIAGGFWDAWPWKYPHRCEDKKALQLALAAQTSEALSAPRS